MAYSNVSGMNFGAQSTGSSRDAGSRCGLTRGIMFEDVQTKIDQARTSGSAVMYSTNDIIAACCQEELAMEQAM